MNKNKDIIYIAQIMGYMNGAGVESVVTNYYKFINKEKFQFDFICCDGSTNIPYEEIERQGGRVFIIPSYKNIFSYYKELKKILKKNDYKIVHSHVNALSVFPLFVAKMAGIPIRIAHSHSTSNKKEKKRNIIKNFLRIFSKIFATNYMCCSKYAGRWLFGEKEFSKGTVTVLNNAIDVEKFVYSEEIRNEKRKELGIENDCLVIGHIGRFMTQKNHDFLIDVFKEIYDNCKNVKLLLIGQGPLKEKIESKVNDLKLGDNVAFLGQREDVNELYQVFDVFLLPSIYEGLPVVGVEAQASGLFCVFSNDMTEETKILETTKFLPLEKGVKCFAEVVLDEIKTFERRNTIVELSNNNFDIRKEVSKLENIYLELLKNC